MKKQKPTAMTATELQRNSGDILKRCGIHKEHFVITRQEYPVVAIIPIGEYDQLMKLLDD